MTFVAEGSRARTLVGTVLTVLVTLFLTFNTVIKLLRLPAAVQETAELGYPAATVFPIGIIELVCLVLCLCPGRPSPARSC